jgi:hypothetical protein
MQRRSLMNPEDQLLEVINRHTDNRAIPELAVALVQNSHRSMNWLIEMKSRRELIFS